MGNFFFNPLPPTVNSRMVGSHVPPAGGGGGNFYALPSDRVTDWTGAGANIATRNTIYTTIAAATYGNGSTDATSGIQTALDACPEGQVVLLGTGTFKIGTSGAYLNMQRPITLRGSLDSSQQPVTFLSRTDGARMDHEPVSANPAPLVLVGKSRYYDTANADWTSTNLSANVSKGSMSITVSSATGFLVDDIVLLDELSLASWQTDPGGRGQILASSDWKVTWQLHNPAQGTDDPLTYAGAGVGGDAASWFCRTDRPTGEWKKISAINGSTITFTTPVHEDYRTANTAQLTRIRVQGQSTVMLHVSGVGIENLKFAGGDNGNIRFEAAANSWAINVESSIWHDECWAVNNCHKITLRHCYTHDAVWAQPGGAGYALSLANSTADSLVEDSIFVRANKVMVSRCAGAGSVIAYNYFDQGYINTNGNWQEVHANSSHMVGPHHTLFEGNYGANFDSDKTHGSSIKHTAFRNHFRGIRKRFTNPHAPAANWQASHAYAVGDHVWNGGNAYECTTAGTSAGSGGPTGTGTPTDGSVVWAYYLCGNPMGGSLTDFDDASQSNGPLRCMGLGYYSYGFNFIGNVLGLSGQMSGWANTGSYSVGTPGIYLLGWDDWNPYPVDSVVSKDPIATADWRGCLIHANYDYLSNTQVQHSSDILTLSSSLYLGATPSWWPGGYTWPWVDPGGATKLYALPSKDRFDAGVFF